MNGWLLLLIVCLAVIVLSTVFDIEGDYVVHDEENGKSFTRRERQRQRAQKRELARMRRQR